MDQELIPHSGTTPILRQYTPPALIDDAGERARKSFEEFFAAQIENDNTRRAYLRAAKLFFTWCQNHDLTLPTIEPTHVTVYFKIHPGSKPTKKQHLAAIRHLFDWLVTN